MLTNWKKLFSSLVVDFALHAQLIVNLFIFGQRREKGYRVRKEKGACVYIKDN